MCIFSSKFLIVAAYIRQFMPTKEIRVKFRQCFNGLYIILHEQGINRTNPVVISIKKSK